MWVVTASVEFLKLSLWHQAFRVCLGCAAMQCLLQHRSQRHSCGQTFPSVTMLNTFNLDKRGETTAAQLRESLSSPPDSVIPTGPFNFSYSFTPSQISASLYVGSQFTCLLSWYIITCQQTQLNEKLIRSLYISEPLTDDLSTIWLRCTGWIPNEHTETWKRF